jgi:hypothetical protein
MYEGRLDWLQQQVGKSEELVEEPAGRRSARVGAAHHEIGEVSRQIAPSVLAAAMSEDARKRGLE